MGAIEKTRRRNSGEARLLLITRMWPTADRPDAGSFVVDRARGSSNITVVGPRRYGRGWLAEYVTLAWDAARAKGPFDGIEAHTLYPAGLIGLVIAYVRRVPLVVYAHGSEVRRATQGSRRYRWVATRIAKAAEVVLANSEDTAPHIRALGREPRIIPPGVDLARFNPTPRPTDRRVLYMGGDRAVKGYEAAEGLADTLVGPGLKEIPPSEVPELIAQHDVVLMPSRAEGFGVLAVEAVASGRWVVASSVGGLREIIQDGINGTLVTDGGYAAALARVPDYDPTTVAKTVARYDLARHQAAMLAVWQEVLSRRRVSSRA